MNWTRGLTRIYFVAWAIFAVAVGALAVSATSDAWREQRAVASFLKDQGSRITLKDLQTRPVDSLRRRLQDRVVAYHGEIMKVQRDATNEEIRAMLGVPAADTFESIRTFDYRIAMDEGYSVAQISDAIARRRRNGGSVYITPKLTSELYQALSDRGLSKDQIAAVSVAGVSKDELEAMQASAQSEAVARPLLGFAKAWGLWLGVCLALPAIVLWTIRWIAAGFMDQRRLA